VDYHTGPGQRPATSTMYAGAAITAHK